MASSTAGIHHTRPIKSPVRPLEEFHTVRLLAGSSVLGRIVGNISAAVIASIPAMNPAEPKNADNSLRRLSDRYTTARAATATKSNGQVQGRLINILKIAGWTYEVPIVATMAMGSTRIQMRLASRSLRCATVPLVFQNKNNAPCPA